ncbi:MAG: bifunctional oligoribonuclease/PAP phosphatase NrnA [Acidimicrobiia bacterium]|nr:bifunctional oligoribonuclease/PAP phosphatase NrnA [Acidimicrobiia bacterium]
MIQGIEAVTAAIARAGSIVTVGHVGPDGDALGSMIALGRSARLSGREAWSTFGEPFVVPHTLRFLDAEGLVPPTRLPEAFDLLVVVDCAEASRLGSAAPLIERAGAVAVIDHHLTHQAFGDVAWIDPDAGATAQMVARVLTQLRWPVDRQVAEALYAGIVTDTGRFQYSSTSPEVHRIAADLLEAGVSPDRIGQHLFAEVPFGFLRLAATVLGRATLEPERSLVWSSLTAADLAAAGVTYEQADGLIDLIRIAEEAEVALLLRQLDATTTKGSLRSRGKIDVSTVAGILGGGGHRNASGFTATGTIDETIERVREAMG